MHNNNEFPDALPSEHRLHWYVLQHVLGQGGFGITYVARDTNLDSTVAIKEYLPVDVATRRPDTSVRSRTDDQADRYKGGLERFIREARTLARFDHPNIVRVHSVFEFNGTAYMVMRFEQGETLAALLERNPSMPEADLRRILLPILDGLELVHGEGFIHRDIKPDNILIRTDGTPVLLDFGSARYALGHSHTVTILVAPGYAPIEQYYDSGESQGPWTDIYGLGATCYRAVTGHAPMDAIARSKGKLGSTQEMLLPALVAGDGRYSARFLKAIDKALEFSERDRPQSIAEWRGMLAEEKKPPARDAALAPVAISPASASRPPWIWALAGGAAVIAVIAFLPGPWRNDAVDRTPATAPRTSENVEELRKQLALLKAEQSQTQTRLTEIAQRATEAEEKRMPAAAPPRMAPQKVEPTKIETRKTETKAETKAEPPQQVALAQPVVVAPPALQKSAPPEKATPPADSIASLRSLAEHNDPTALVRLGDSYLRGDGVERSDQEAARLYRRAADGGSAEAQLRLGDLYSKGQGVPQNDFQAYVWYSVAARGGNGSAKASQERTAKLLQAAEVQQAKKVVDAMAGRGK